MCCTRLAENTERKNYAENSHLRTIAQICCTSRLGFVTAPTSLSGRQPNFARYLAVSCTGILYIHFRGLLPSNGILPSAKFTLCPSLPFTYIGSVTARHSSTGRQPKFAAWYKECNYGAFAEGANYIRQAGHHVVYRSTF